MFFELAALAYLIDMVFGEFPCKHPVVLMGDFINGFERRFYSDRILPGALLAVGLIALALLVSVILVYLCGLLPTWLSLIVLAIFASTGLAMNMLHDSVAALLTAEQPKQALSYLVSRDTEDMTETEIYKAGLETWAENLSDGVIAPLFYLLLFGLPGIAVYKAINTMDSMVAYKTERYFYFGKTAAIVDDIANYIPARLTALLIVALAKDKRRTWQCLWRDGNKLESPNAGFPIAAMAGALGVALGGDASYHGQIKHKPTLGLPLRPVDKSTLTT
ncbi:MAG: adenosylcobinamide-phosphate synthase CbiB, partial [Methylobacter tundripaludum]|nr:adenosylcobinamide-phosphate synthase CbiB [Methylobacter tundripaludum]